MKITGVIAEYNPFHNGHFYQLSKIKEESDAVIIVLSGPFTQRGIPGIFDQHLRAKMALLCGADLVFELPTVFSTGSAEYFAKGSISLLDKLGVVDYLSFGSESGNITELIEYSTALLDITDEQNNSIKSYLNQGLTYPEARQKALNLDNTILNNPNNILAIEYLKALKSRNSSIVPTTVKRIGNYLDSDLSEDMLSSAMAIRSALSLNKPLSSIKMHVPADIYTLLESEQNYYPIFMDDFSDFLFYKLLENMETGYNEYFDVGSSLSNTFINSLSTYKNVSSFIENCKSKNYTYTRVNRALTHILLNIRQDFACELCDKDYTQYAKLLGFTKKGEEVLKLIKSNSSIPVISKSSKADTLLTGTALDSFKTDIFAAQIYQSLKSKKYNTPYLNEYSTPIIKI